LIFAACAAYTAAILLPTAKALATIAADAIVFLDMDFLL
jgi:hypothetical protein